MKNLKKELDPDFLQEIIIILKNIYKKGCRSDFSNKVIRIMDSDYHTLYPINTPSFINVFCNPSVIARPIIT